MTFLRYYNFFFILAALTFFLFTDALINSLEASNELNKEAIELFQKGQREKALDKIYRALDSEPLNIEYRYNLALMLYKFGNRYVEAKKACEDVLSINKNHANAKVLLKGCLDKILQGEGVKNDTQLAVSPFLETKKVVHAKVSDVPEELKQFLQQLYLDKNFNEAYIYFTSASKKAVSKEEYKNYMSNVLKEEDTGTARDVKIISVNTNEKDGYGAALFDLIYEKELKQPLKSALGGYNTILEKKKGFIFFIREEDKWSVIPPDFIIDNFIFLCSKFPDVLSYTGTEWQLENEWTDSNLVELEKMADFLQNKKPEDALALRIKYNALAFLKERKDKNYAAMYDRMASIQHPLVSNKLKYIKDMTQQDLKTIIRDIKINDIVIKSSISSIKYTMEMFNSVGNEALSVNKLVSYVMVVKDGINWKVCDLWRGKWFLEKYPSLYKEFNPGDDQYLEYNGRDWIDRSIEYNSIRREKMVELENKL